MSSKNASSFRKSTTRRDFLKSTSLLGAGLTLGFFIPGSGKFAQAQNINNQSIRPNAFLHISPDETITVMINRVELGQGVYTSLAMLIAEELDANWSTIRPVLAPAGNIFNDPVIGIQMTGGSLSIKNSYEQYRTIGAQARLMLLSAAATKWSVAPSECKTLKGKIFGPNGQTFTYGQLSEAAMLLPIPDRPTLKDPRTFKIIGKPTPRLDSYAKVTGKQKFGIDFKLPNLKTALIAHPPTFGGRVEKFDAKKALSTPGVIEIFQIDTDRGGSGIAVIADGYWQAKQARDLLDITWNTSAVEKVDSEKQLKDYRNLALKTGIIAKNTDVSKLSSAPQKITAEFNFPYLAHAPMETLNCTIRLKNDSCEVWAGSQYQTVDKQAIVKSTGLKPDQVKLNTLMAGGGFGRRAVPTSDYLVEGINIAKTFKAKGYDAPIKLMWSREDDIRGGYYRPAHVHRAEIGLDAKGNVIAWDHVIVGQSITQGTFLEESWFVNGIDQTMVEGMAEPYNLPIRLSVHMVKANVPVLWWRSVGSTHTAFVTETLIDEIASISNTDPVALRKKLIPKNNIRHHAVLDAVIQKSGYGIKKLKNGHAYGVAIHESFNSVVGYVVEASIENGAPKLHKVYAAVHCNLPINPMTIEAQVQGALLMGLGTTLPNAAITLKNGVVEQQNFGDYAVARISDMPKVEVHIIPSTESPTGMGEPGLPPLAPAFANALAKLTGKRIRDLPFKLI